MRTFLKSARLTTGRRLRLLPLLLVVAFLASQHMSLQHTHDGDLAAQYDCEICLKLGSSDDAIITVNTELAIQPSIQAAVSEITSIAASLILAANSRAPPRQLA